MSPKKSKSDLSQIDAIMNFYRKDDAPLLFIFINNIESGGLSKSFYTLSKLVALDKIKLICSVDKVSFWIEKGLIVKWGASSRWSFSPNSVWGRKETTTIGITHLTLVFW